MVARDRAVAREGGRHSLASSPSLLLQLAGAYERKGHLEEAAGGYEAAIRAAEAYGSLEVLAEALRRLAVVRHRGERPAEARELAERSRSTALLADNGLLAAEAVNTLGGFELVEEQFGRARERFLQARVLAARHTGMLGRVEQNLGTIASLQGNVTEALGHYRRSLDAFRAAGNDHGCAIAQHNLGVASMDLRRWPDADGHLQLCLRALASTDDLHLRGLALLNHAEVLVALARLREARISVEGAAAIFDQLRAPAELADAFRVLGVVCRETGEPATARSRFALALEVATSAGSELGEAETRRELAVLDAREGRPAEAVAQLTASTRVLNRLRPALDSSAVTRGEYPVAVLAWGAVLELVDPAAFACGECVAEIAGAGARGLGWDPERGARVRLAGYLHRIGVLHLADDRSSLIGVAERSALLLEQAGFGWGLAALLRDLGRPPAADQDRWSLEAQLVAVAARYVELAAERAPGAGLARLELERDRWEDEAYQAVVEAVRS